MLALALLVAVAVAEEPVVTPPGTVSVAISGTGVHTAIEILCPSGHRERVDIADGRVTFTKVPDEGCKLLFKGGMPATFEPVRWGSYQCFSDARVFVCAQR